MAHDKPVKLRAYLRRLPITGANPEGILADCAVPAEAVERLDLMEDALVVNLFHALALHTPPDFAFECGRRAKIGDLGVLGYRLLFCRDMRDVFKSWARYSSGSHPPFSTVFQEQGGEWRFIQRPRLHFSEDAMRFCTEAALTSFFCLTRQMVDGDMGVRRLELPYSRPPQGRDYEALGFGEVRFDAPDLAIIGNSDALDQELEVNDPKLSEMLAPQLAAMSALAAEESSWSDRILAMFQVRCPPPTKEEMASQLGLSSRSLHRELAREGTGFRDLLDRYRRSEMERLRSHPAIALKELSWRLGFSDVGSYRRWERRLEP